jgi:hypothetical protein
MLHIFDTHAFETVIKNTPIFQTKDFTIDVNQKALEKESSLETCRCRSCYNLLRVMQLLEIDSSLKFRLMALRLE